MPVQCWSLKNHSKKGCFYVAVIDVIGSTPWCHEVKSYPSLIVLTVPQNYHQTTLRPPHLQFKCPMSTPPPFINTTCSDVVSLLGVMVSSCPSLRRALLCLVYDLCVGAQAQEISAWSGQCEARQAAGPTLARPAHFSVPLRTGPEKPPLVPSHFPLDWAAGFLLAVTFLFFRKLM